MRNLKRVLSLALALVMMLGMMIVTSSAAGAKVDFADADEITNTEAVDVMVALGIIEGDGTNFNPTDILTREQAAKIICYMLMGPSNAEKLSKNTSIFVDVAAGRWSAGYIAYCANLGILAGNGDGTFDPEGQLTSVAFGKMLLTALGYDAEVEGYVNNPNWATNIATDMIAAEIDVDGITLDAPVSRDNACQMAFNTLMSNTVAYNTKTEVNTGDAVVTVSGGRYNIGRSGSDYRGFVEAGNDGYQQFCEKYFSTLKASADVDAFMRPATTWTVKGTKVGTYVDEATLTYTASVTLGTLYTDLGLSKSYNVDYYYIDGLLGSDFTIARGVNNARIGGNGVLTQVYKTVDNNGVVDVKVVLMNTYVAEIGAVTPATASADRYVTLTTKTVPGTLDGNFETEDFAVRDLVSYTAAWDGNSQYTVQSVKALELSDSGLLTQWVGDANTDSSSTFTANGTTYKYSAKQFVKSTNNKVADFTVKASELDVYLDDYGYALYVEETKTATNYAVVIGQGATNPYGSTTNGATLLLADGTVQEVTYRTQDTLSGDSPNTNTVKDAKGDLVTYTIGGDGVYTLKLVDAYDTTATLSSITFTNGKSYFTDNSGAAKYTTSKTIFFVATPDGKGGQTYKVYTGYNEMPTLSPSDNTGFAIAYATGAYTNQVNAVYITAGKLAGVSGVKTFVAKSSTAEVTTDSTGSYYVLPAIVDGAVTTVKLGWNITADIWSGDVTSTDTTSDATLNTTTGVIALDNIVMDSNGIIVSADVIQAETQADTGKVYMTATGTVAPNGVVVGFASSPSKFWAYNDETKVYTVDSQYKKISESYVEAITTDADDVAYFTVNDATKVLETVIIKKVNPGTPSGSSPVVIDAANYAFDFSTPGDVKALVYSGLTAAEKTELTVLDQLKANLKLLGYTSFVITDNGSSVYTIVATKDDGDQTFTWNAASPAADADFDNTGIKVKVDGVDYLVTGSDYINALVTVDDATVATTGTWAKVTKADGTSDGYKQMSATVAQDGYKYETGYYEVSITGTVTHSGMTDTGSISTFTAVNNADGTAKAYVKENGTVTIKLTATASSDINLAAAADYSIASSEDTVKAVSATALWANGTAIDDGSGTVATVTFKLERAAAATPIANDTTLTITVADQT